MVESMLVFWIRSNGREGLATNDQMGDSVDAFRTAAGATVPSHPYRLVESGHTTRRLGEAKHHIEPPFHSRLTDRDAPDLMVFAIAADLDEARAVNRNVRAASNADRFSLVASGYYAVLQHWRGIDDDSGDFADVVHFGTYDTGVPDDEWALADYYADVRMPAFVGQPGAVRARRLTTACAAPGRTAVLYEFTSLEARLTNFEPLEGEGVAAEAQSLTRHLAISPSIGVRVR
jgi:hypothetical protein